MKLIKQNPYRVIGILAGSNQRTIAKQKAKINAFQKVGKKIEFDSDLKIAGAVDRSIKAVEKAFANIEINQDKTLYALFWFVGYNHLDETALNYLQSGNIEKAEEIWHKITEGKEVNSKNYTAFNNLSTLKIDAAFVNGAINLEKLKEGIRLKTVLITSDNFIDFCRLVADETYTIDQEKELENFVSALIEEIEKLKVSGGKKVPALMASIHPKLKFVVSDKLTDTPIYNIERIAEQTKKKRNNNPGNGLQLARELYSEIKDDLTTLSDILGKTDVKYKMIADKLAKELLQCGIDYFKKYQDEELHYHGNLGEDVMRLFKTTKNIAVGVQTKERINENIAGLQEWIDNSDERHKQKLIDEDLKYIAAKLERFQHLNDSIEKADELVTSCKPKLQNMKNELGAYDDFYLKISSAVVNNAQGMLVAVVNEAQQDHSVQLGLLDELKTKIRGAVRVSEKLGTLDMLPELRERYKKNHSTLKSIENQLRISSQRTNRRPTSTAPTSRSSSGNSGCVVLIILAVIIGLVVIFNNSNDNYTDNYKDSSDASQNRNTGYEKVNDESVNTGGQSENQRYKGNQLTTGVSPYNDFFGKGIYSQNHENWVEFDNGNNYDAIVCLVNANTEKTIRNEYIQAGSAFKMTNIPNGTYYIKVFYGKDWNPNKGMNNGRIKGGFETDSHFSKSDGIRDRLTLNDDGYQYSTYSITLYTVNDGNMSQQDINENEFF